MRFCLFDHQHKGQGVARTLVAAGWESVSDISACDVLLIDHDGWYAHPRPELISAAYGSGARVVLYPHGAMPTVTFYDGAYAPDWRVAARLEHGEGHLEIGRRCGLDGLRQHVVGWTYTDVRPFHIVKPRRILFAPIQPNGNGYLAPHDDETNREAADALRGLPFDIHVRHPGAPGSVLDACTEIDRSDVIVAAGTLAYTAVARGKAVVMMDDRNLEHDTEPQHLSLYDSYLRYPLMVGDDDITTLIGRACCGSDEVQAWADLFVTGPPANIPQLLEEVVSSPAPTCPSPQAS